jgi:hypothetical protein
MPEPNYRELADRLMQMATNSPVYAALSALAGRSGDPIGRLNVWKAQNRRAGPYMFDPSPMAQQNQNYGMMSGGAQDLPPQLITAPQQTDQTMQPQRPDFQRAPQQR